MFTTDFIIYYNKNSDIGFTLVTIVDYQEYLNPLHSNLLFSPEKIVIDAFCHFLNEDFMPQCTITALNATNELILNESSWSHKI